MKQTNEERQETSIPVVTRVSIVDLAKLANFWEEKKYVIRTMSQLVAWSIELLVNELEANEFIPDSDYSLAYVHRDMNRRGLIQRSMSKRTESRIRMAMGFESLREEGVDPRSYSPTAYRNMHQPQSREPLPEALGKFEKHNPDEVILEEYMHQPGEKPFTYRSSIPGDRERVIAMLERAKIKTKKQFVDEQIAIAREAGIIRDTPEEKVTVVREGMTLEEAEKHIADADAERIALENGPVEEQIKWMKEHQDE